VVDIARITKIVEPEARALGFDLVRVAWFKGGEIGGDGDLGGEHTLQIMAERPETGQLVIDDCAALSHRVSDAIDAIEEAGEVLIGEPYRLEVSSPGIDRPLMRLKDFAKWAGYEAKIELKEPVAGQKRFRGVLDGVGSKGDVIAIVDKQGVRNFVPFDQVHSAKLVLTDRLIAANRPLDTSGADVILEEEG
jgi:ribosome maturation factor RimP